MLAKMKVYTWERGDRQCFRAVRTDNGAAMGGDVDTREHLHGVLSTMARVTAIPLTVIIRARPGKVART